MNMVTFIMCSKHFKLIQKKDKYFHFKLLILPLIKVILSRSLGFTK